MPHFTESIAREAAVLSIARFAESAARNLGSRSADPLFDIMAGREKIQARRVIMAALMTMHGIDAPQRKIIAHLSSLELGGPDDHERQAEIWEMIEDIARAEAREAHDYARR